jgi:GntR family phosphonate transport system transcriptional regulator
MSTYHIAKTPGAQPVYRQISEQLAEKVRRCHQAGDQLPPEHDLAALFGVNRHTLRRAVDELVSDGLVQRRHGMGVYVIDPSISYGIGRRTRFTQTLEAQGYRTTSRLLSKTRLQADKKIAEALSVAEGADVIWIETLREVETAPFCVISHYLPIAVCPTLFDQYQGGSLHDFLHKECGIKLTRQQSRVSALLPSIEDAERLRMPLRMPLLRVKSLNLDATSGRPVEYAVTRFRGDGAELDIQL